MSGPVTTEIDFSRGHVWVANCVTGWTFDQAGGAHLDETGVAAVDRMVAALLAIAGEHVADVPGVARRALTGE